MSLFWQGFGHWHIEGFTGYYTTAQQAVIALKYRISLAFGAAGEEIPVTFAACVVDRRMAPVEFDPRARGAACLDVGRVGIGQAKAVEFVIGAAQQSVEGRQVFRLRDGAFRGTQNMFGAKVAEAFQPQLLDRAELGFVGKGLVILVVIVEAKQRKNLVDRVNLVFVVDGPSWPSFGR